MLLVMVLLLSLVVGEVLVRWRQPRSTSLAWRVMQPDPEVYLVWKPGSRETRVSPWGAYRIRINGQGLRMDREVRRSKAPGVHRIAALGDSFAFGAGVEVGEGFVRRLERLLQANGAGQLEILNFAVGGYALTHALVRWGRDVVPYAPDDVVVFYCYNDLGSNRDPSNLNPLRFHFEDGRVRIEQRPTGTAWQRFILGFEPYQWLRRRSYLLAAVLQAARRELRSSKLANPDMEGDEDRSPADQLLDYAASDALLRRMVALARRTGARLWVVFVPTSRELDQEEEYFRRFSRRTAALAADAGFEFIDPLPRLRAAWSAAGRPPLAYPDHHYNPLGHRLFAEAVAKLMLERWPDRPPSGRAD